MKHPLTQVPGYSDNIDTARLLLTMGHADVNAVNDNGDTPLTFAITAGLNSIVDYLLSVPGVYLGAAQPDKPTPATLARQIGNRHAAVSLMNAHVRASDELT